MQASYTPHIREIGTTGRFRLSVPARPLTLDELQRLADAAGRAARLAEADLVPVTITLGKDGWHAFETSRPPAETFRDALFDVRAWRVTLRMSDAWRREVA